MTSGLSWVTECVEGPVDLSNDVGCASRDVLVGEIVCTIDSELKGWKRPKNNNRWNVHPRLAKKPIVLLLNPGSPFAGAGNSKYVTLVNWSCHLDV